MLLKELSIQRSSQVGSTRSKQKAVIGVGIVSTGFGREERKSERRKGCLKSKEVGEARRGDEREEWWNREASA